MAEILIAEDEVDVREGLKVVLEAEGHQVRVVGDGVQAMEAFTQKTPHLLLLDMEMPRMTGLEVCVRVRIVNNLIPIFMMTSRNEESDIVTGLGLGADDYLVKPLRMPELLARIEAALRRQRNCQRLVSKKEGRYVFGTGTLDLQNQLFQDGPNRRVLLTSLQTAILRLFVKNPDHVHTRPELHEKGWGCDSAKGYRAIDQQIAKLRKKLGPSGALIETVSGVGYRYHIGF